MHNEKKSMAAWVARAAAGVAEAAARAPARAEALKQVRQQQRGGRHCCAGMCTAHQLLQASQ